MQTSLWNCVFCGSGKYAAAIRKCHFTAGGIVRTISGAKTFHVNHASDFKNVFRDALLISTPGGAPEKPQFVTLPFSSFASR